jgi:pilus assembly protein Flp/PilA
MRRIIMNRSLHNKKQKGQGLVEYALILVLVAVVVIAVLLVMGPTIGNIFTKINSGVAGQAGAGPAPTQNTCQMQAANGMCFDHYVGAYAEGDTASDSACVSFIANAPYAHQHSWGPGFVDGIPDSLACYGW